MKIGFIGTGKMGSALVDSVCSKLDHHVIISGHKNANLEKLSRKHQVKVANNIDLAKEADIVFLCVKPYHIEAVLKEISSSCKGKLIVSIAAGIKIKKIEPLVDARIIRVMPNINCLAGEMAAGISKGSKATQKDLDLVKSILDASGKSFIVPEDSLDTVTALSGAGPAFVAYLVKAFYEAGKEQGLDEKTALNLTIQTFLGSAKLLETISPDELIAMVATKGGSTEAGLEVFESSDAKEVIKKVVNAAASRSKELGK